MRKLRANELNNLLKILSLANFQTWIQSQVLLQSKIQFDLELRDSICKTHSASFVQISIVLGTALEQMTGIENKQTKPSFMELTS